MRYRIGQSPAHPDIPATEHMIVFTAVLSLFIGVALVVMGRQGAQRWLTFWGATLVLSSALYLGLSALGYA